MSKRWMAACRLHALSFNYTAEEIDECSKSSQGLFPGLAHARQSREPWIACQEFPATNLRRCRDHPAKMAHVLRPSLKLSAPPPRPASCSTGLAGHHSFAEHPSRKAKPSVPNHSTGRKLLSQVLAPLWYRSRQKPSHLPHPGSGGLSPGESFWAAFFNFGITKLNSDHSRSFP